MDDNQTISNILSGDKDAYGLLMNRYHNEVFSFVYQMIGQYQKTEDIVQDIFIKVYKNLSKFNSTKASFRTWLYRIANNHTINVLKSTSYKNNQSSLEFQDYQEASSENIESELIKDEQIKKILSAMQRVLKPKHQKIVTLHYFSGLSVKEIREVTGVPDKTIYHALQSSIDKIKKQPVMMSRDKNNKKD
jgi:RNA polymerase sigma-70 factor (ECF subfamily)